MFRTRITTCCRSMQASLAVGEVVHSRLAAFTLVFVLCWGVGLASRLCVTPPYARSPPAYSAYTQPRIVSVLSRVRCLYSAAYSVYTHRNAYSVYTHQNAYSVILPDGAEFVLAVVAVVLAPCWQVGPWCWHRRDPNAWAPTPHSGPVRHVAAGTRRCAGRPARRCASCTRCSCR